MAGIDPRYANVDALQIWVHVAAEKTGEGAMTIDAGTKAHAYPTKEFFVKMITRDITLSDCILDLIDNSIDSAWRSEGGGATELKQDNILSKYSISISVSPDSFCIEDNCGGMTLDDAVSYAFSFGKREDDQFDPYSIGAYGIGMKRAIFKLGTDIRVRSSYLAAAGSRESFAVPIDVNAWLLSNDPPWDFDIVTEHHLRENGVQIAVRSLTDDAAGLFASQAFVRDLRRMIARDYSLHLDRGLRITLNGKAISGWKIELRQSSEFVPMRFAYQDQTKGNEVGVEIIGGMSAASPEGDEPEDFIDRERRYGWYVICNGRIVLAADQSTASGWGTEDWPQWHPQYAGFMGIIMFNAVNAVALPLTTTKRSIDDSSEIYRRARPRMRELTRKWIDYTNERKQALEEAKQKEREAQPISIYSVTRQTAVKLPALIARIVDPVANVQYSVPLAKMHKLARQFGSINLSYREVGLRSFDYAYEEKVGEE